MFYQTRVMVALQNFLHGPNHIRKNDQFVATEIDANYLSKHKRATYAPEVAAAPAPVAAPVSAPAPAPAEPPVSAPAAAAESNDAPVSPADAAVLTTADLPSEPPAADAAPEPDPAPAPAARRRTTRSTPDSE